MKPIEIHIEGYKIVISKEDDDIHTKAMEEKIVYIPKPKIIPTPNTPDPYEYPYVTWTNDDTFNINTTSTKEDKNEL